VVAETLSPLLRELGILADQAAGPVPPENPNIRAWNVRQESTAGPGIRGGRRRSTFNVLMTGTSVARIAQGYLKVMKAWREVHKKLSRSASITSWPGIYQATECRKFHLHPESSRLHRRTR
jgi:hypothetical protein